MISLPQCTAEQVLDAVEAVVLSLVPPDAKIVSEFTGASLSVTERALSVATALEMLIEDKGTYRPVRLVGHFFGSATEPNRIDLLRAFVETYPPYGFFKQRLALHGEGRKAARETKVRFGVNNDEEEIRETLVSLGQYCGSLEFEAKTGLKVVQADGQESYLSAFEIVSRSQATADQWIRAQLGAEAYAFVQDENDGIVTNLRDALIQLEQAGTGGEAVYFLGKALENFENKIAASRTPPVALGGTGVNSKADELRRASAITTKHFGLLCAIGHARNAADHGGDTEIGGQWVINDDSARTLLKLAMVAIRSVVSGQNGRYEI